MKIPAKVEYAYKAILELSLRYRKNGPVQLSTISEAQGIPKKFLIQLLLCLKNANIVNSSRGIAGGYYLTRPPSQISLADVVRAIDETIIGPPREDRRSKASEADKLLGRIWADAAKETARRLEEMTFDKLAAQIGSEQFTYQI
jgi:Rrf2 family protein